MHSFVFQGRFFFVKSRLTLDFIALDSVSLRAAWMSTYIPILVLIPFRLQSWFQDSLHDTHCVIRYIWVFYNWVRVEYASTDAFISLASAIYGQTLQKKFVTCPGIPIRYSNINVIKVEKGGHAILLLNIYRLIGKPRICTWPKREERHPTSRSINAILVPCNLWGVLKDFSCWTSMLWVYSHAIRRGTHVSEKVRPMWNTFSLLIMV